MDYSITACMCQGISLKVQMNFQTKLRYDQKMIILAKVSFSCYSDSVSDRAPG